MKSFHSALEEKRSGFPRHYLKALKWIVVLTGVVFWLEMSGMLRGLDTAALDTFLRATLGKRSNNVTLVEIGEKDYQEMFSGRSPLCRDVLFGLVARVRSYRPAVIGVDINTSDAVDPSQSCHGDENADLSGLMEDQGPPVIWAEVPKDNGKQLELTRVLSEKDGTAPAVTKLRDLVPSKPRPQKVPAKLEDFVGIPRFPVDSDGLVRHYESEIPVTGTLESRDPNPSSLTSLPSLARALVDNSNVCSSPQGSEAGDSNARQTDSRAPESSNAPLRCPLKSASGDPLIFNFYGNRYQFPIIDARDFQDSYADLQKKNPDLAEIRKRLLGEKIVLIGGTYEAARDIYPTPLGEMAGVELNALAVQSDLSGGGIGEEQWWESVAIDVLFGSLVVVVFFAWARRPRVAFAVAFLGLSAAAFGASLLLFSTFSYFLNFMPVIVGMTLHQTVELAHAAGHLRQELDARKKEIRDLQREKQVLSDQLVLTNLLWESRERDREQEQEVTKRARGAGA